MDYTAPRNLSELTADCAACRGLCCVAPAFDKGEDFAIAKLPLTPCQHLADDNRCKRHEDLEDHGFPGCARFDCLGAGQHVVQGLYDGADWRGDGALLKDMAESYRRMQRLHEALQMMFLAERLPLDEDQEVARLTLLRRLRPVDGWTPDSLAKAEARGLFAQVRDTLTSFRSAVRR